MNPTPPPFCRDCKWLENQHYENGPVKMRQLYCLRPNRQILDMVSGLPMLAYEVAASADRSCVHPGACGTQAAFFEER